MKIVNNRAMVLKTKRPHLVTERVKNYKVSEQDDGYFKLALPWRLHEAQVLNSLGVKDVPSPIG